MRRTILAALALSGMLAAATSASALSVGTTDVGGLDTLVASTKLTGTSPEAESIWVNSILGSGYVITYVKTEFSGDRSTWWKQTDVTGTYAMATPDNPEYFMIKTGNLNGSADYRNFLFDNKDSMAWAVVDLDESFGILDVANIGKFSHIGEINEGGNTPVPEPGTMMLLGVGMFGLAIFGKRRMNK